MAPKVERSRILELCKVYLLRPYRKVGSRSRVLYLDVRRVGHDGSYIYKEFKLIEGTYAEVYTISSEYVFAEVRKSLDVDEVIRPKGNLEENKTIQFVSTWSFVNIPNPLDGNAIVEVFGLTLNHLQELRIEITTPKESKTQGLMLVSEKVVAIQTWSTPTIVKEVWQEQCRLQGNKLGLSSVYHDDPTFLKAWNQINDPIRPLDNPLRSPFQDVYKIDGIATIIVGHVETGVLKHGICARM
ncbi:hypothetical protein V6N12_074589 [Hibiscus sabdariffa]|uniref:rRNA N-glycosidase n=1 Tax=Hibiscus sabdariffa TaxID=183260 RepID=A0ABR2BY95_9ROSI